MSTYICIHVLHSGSFTLHKGESIKTTVEKVGGGGGKYIFKRVHNVLMLTTCISRGEGVNASSPPCIC